MSEVKDNNVTTDAPITFTEGALKELHKLKNSLDITEEQGLRIGVKGGGCSGMSYLLAFDDKTDKDMVYNLDGIPVFIEKAHSMYIIGMEVDYQDGLNSRGFVFNNPNAKTTCGCGTSFAA